MQHTILDEGIFKKFIKKSFFYVIFRVVNTENLNRTQILEKFLYNFKQISYLSIYIMLSSRASNDAVMLSL